MRSLARTHRVVIGACIAWQALVAGAGAVNLARSRPYTWSRPPQYRACTDPGDAAQLTDGRLAKNDYIWLDRACVGWELQTGDIVTWTLDLGSTCALDSVVVRTAWFTRTGVVPPALLCAVGDAPGRFQWAGALDAETLAHPDPTRPARVALAVPLHRARGRWVLIAALLRSDFLFSDEIEVHGTATPDAGSASTPPSGPISRSFDPAEIDAVGAVQRRVWALRRALPGPVPVPSGTPTARGTSLHAKDADAVNRTPLDPPASAEEAARLAARARSWRAAGAARLIVRRVDPWAPTSPWSALQAERSDTLELWPGAWGAAAIEIAAAGDSTAHVALRVAAGATGSPRAILREVVPVEARDGRWAGDALPLAPATLDVPPGAVRQVWVDVDASRAAAGLHRLRIEAGGQTVNLAVRVHAVGLGAPALAALDWTYPDKFALTRQAPEAAVRDNLDHGIDSWCLAEESVPWPDPASIDASGHITRPLDFTTCDRHLALHTALTARRILWFWNFDAQAKDPSRGRFRHPYLSPAWRRAVSEWLEAWLAHLDALGYERRRMVMQPIDEASSPAVRRLYAALRAERPGLPLALTVTRNAAPAELRSLAPHLALAIVERRALEKDASWIREAMRRGMVVWTYDVPQPSKTVPPLAGYRLLPWEAWARGLTGCGFWAYGDTRLSSADAWNDFDAERCDHAVVYGEAGAPRPLGGESFAPSKRWQAFRMGLEDTALLAAALPRQPGLRAAALAGLGHGSAFDPDAERRRLLRLLE